MGDAGAQSGRAGGPRRKLYGRRHGKRLRPNQQRLLDDLLPRVAIAGVSPWENPARLGLAPEALFADERPLWLEIGFGGGEHLVHQALGHPDKGLIGCEPFVNGVAMALTRIDAAGGLSNIRLHPGDARDLVELLPQGRLTRVFLLYPDPWPKARHARRRFASAENLLLLARAMAPGAEFRLATDIPPYVAHAREAVAGVSAFDELPRDISVAWQDWPGTRYEAKALAGGRRPHYLTFRRR